MFIRLLQGWTRMLSLRHVIDKEKLPRLDPIGWMDMFSQSGLDLHVVWRYLSSSLSEPPWTAAQTHSDIVVSWW